MPFQVPTQTYSGKIEEVTIGTGEKSITLGGETTLAWHEFEGEIASHPKVAMEVYDNNPSDWPEAINKEIAEVASDPVKWALKCQNEWSADLVCLQLASTDPNGEDRSGDAAAKTVSAVLEAIDIPLIVYGTENAEKDKEVLEKVANVASGKNIGIGPATEENYKTIAAAVMGFDLNIIALTPCDVNLAKQLNIHLSQMGLSKNKIIIDPSTGALGYGLDYTYTIIERLKLAALQQGDEMTRFPVICNLGIESWKTKEAKVTAIEEPSWGDGATRAISWELMTALSMATAGADLLVMRHPEAVAGFKKTVRAITK